MPVGSEDLLKAISHSMNSSLTGQYAVRGSDEHSMKEILALIETAAGKEAGSSKTSNEWMELPAQLMAEFSFGQTQTKNMEHLVKHFEQNADMSPVPGDCFWNATATKPTGMSVTVDAE